MALELKEHASRTFAEVAAATAHLFPEPKYRPVFGADEKTCFGIDVHPHKVFGNSDGIGTKPELAERLADMTLDSRHFETLAFDVIAMIVDDAARDGRFVVGVLNSVDPNTADPEMITALASGMRKACEEGRFPLLNGETAELGYRTAGWGNKRVNWNAGAMQLVNEQKIIDGSRLRPGQPIVGLREQSIRSNGLSRARAIMERAHIGREGSKASRMEHIIEHVRSRTGMNAEQIEAVLGSTPMGSHLWQYIQVAWHLTFPELTEELLRPSRLYSPLMYAAQGGVDGDVRIPIVANAHVSGGGVPRKASRMTKRMGLGVNIHNPFPDPEGVRQLIDLTQKYPDPHGGPLVDERSASIHWNRGLGFLCAVENRGHAEDLLQLGKEMQYEAAIVGEVTQEPVMRFRGESWTHEQAEASA